MLVLVEVVSHQSLRGVELDDFSGVQNHDLGAVHDGVEPVSDGQHRALGKLLPDGGLEKNQFPIVPPSSSRFRVLKRDLSELPVSQIRDNPLGSC